MIYGETKPLGDRCFSAAGLIARPDPSGNGERFEASFDAPGSYATVSACSAAIATAKELINGYWAAYALPTQVLLVEDNPGDILPTEDAFPETNPSVKVHVARDGAQAMDFLRRERIYSDCSRPDLILLDLNLPKMDGRDVLSQIKNDDHLKTIPVAILTSSENDSDIAKCYQLQANCYLSKPLFFEGFRSLIESINDFWLTRVKMPQ